MSPSSTGEGRALTRRQLLVGGAVGALGATLALAACSDDDRRAGSSGMTSTTGAAGGDRREVVPYGQHRLNTAELQRPDAPGPTPVVVLIHGGFWRQGYQRTLMAFLADDLVGRGYAVWNVEYRSSGDRGGGWPGTFRDVAAAIDTLRGVGDIDLDRVFTVGHSAGGHLATWAALRPGLPAGAPGESPQVLIRGAVSQAGVVDLVAAAEEHLGSDATQALLGGEPDEVPERYELASPAERTPIGVPTLLVHGADDDIVPVAQSEVLHERAVAAGDECELVVVPGAGHFEHLDPAASTWDPVVRQLAVWSG